MTSPYSDLPDSAFWRRSVAQPPKTSVDPVNPPPFGISDTDQVMTAGSCFAQHIARYMRICGLEPMVTEPGHPILSPDQKSRWNYGTFSARYGNIYVARQLLQLIRRVYGKFTPVEDLWERDGVFLDPFRPQIQPGGFATRAEFDIDREQHFEAVRRGFEDCDVFVFTLGLTEGWLSLEDGAVFPLCPGTAGGEFDPARHTFHNFTVDEIVTDMVSFLDELRAVNPDVRVILTVSPVPLIASASGSHVLQATTYSKSVLRVVCEMLQARQKNLFYFPSYEVITGQHARGSYMADDLRSIREEGVAHVMKLFLHHLCGIDIPDIVEDEAEPAQHAGDEATRAAARVVRVACDEEMLDAQKPEAATVRGTGPALYDRRAIPSDPPSHIDTLPDAVVTPVAQYEAPRVDPASGKVIEGMFDGGLYYADGSLCAAGENRYLTHAHRPANRVDPARSTQTLPGRHLFAGLAQNFHFGHFLTENTARLWALDHVGDVDGILVQARFPNQPLSDPIARLFDLFAPGIPVIPITAQTGVETLILPQALRFPQGAVFGHPLNRTFFSGVVERVRESSGATDTPKRIFVSRAALPRAGARFVLEEDLDANFRAQGYTVIHPEKLPISEQMRLYAGATHLVFSEGSAIHLYALAAQPGQKVFFIWRRKVMHPIFDRQIASFGAGPLVGDNHVLANLPSLQFPSAPARSSSLADFESLGRDLAAQGFIDTPEKWITPKPAKLQKALDGLSDIFDVSAARAALPQVKPSLFARR